MAPLPFPFSIIVRPDKNSPLQLLSNENDAGEITTTNIFPRSQLSPDEFLAAFHSVPSIDKLQNWKRAIPSSEDFLAAFHSIPSIDKSLNWKRIIPSSEDFLAAFHSIPSIDKSLNWKRTLPSPSSLVDRILRRQSDNNIVPSAYGNINSGPSPGTVVGIVLGSVAGFLLLLWLLYTVMTLNRVDSRSSYTESVVVRDRKRSTGSHRSRRTSNIETVQINRDRSPIRRETVREEVRHVPMSAPPPPPQPGRVIVEERRETRRERSPGASDEVVVIEEHSPPRRTKSKRERRRSRSIDVESVRERERESGYRTVDPVSYGGGAAPLRGVGKSRKSGR